MKFNAPLVITIIYLVMVFALLILMGMEVIHNQRVIDRLLITIPVTGALIGGFWFSKLRKNGGSEPPPPQP